MAPYTQDDVNSFPTQVEIPFKGGIVGVGEPKIGWGWEWSDYTVYMYETVKD